MIKAGRAATGSRDVRCTVSIGGFVPKPHTPFQWFGQNGVQERQTRQLIDRSLRALNLRANAEALLGIESADGTRSRVAS